MTDQQVLTGDKWSAVSSPGMTIISLPGEAELAAEEERLMMEPSTSTAYPFNDITASTDFHLLGQHDQSTHAGHATVAESIAAVHLAGGGKLDETDPENARIAGAVRGWTEGGNSGARVRHEVQGAVADPTADTPGAALARTVAAAPPGSPVLHRGMRDVPAHEIPNEGDVFDLAPTSFTRSKKVMEQFSRPEEGGNSSFGSHNMVHITVKKGSRTIQVSQYAPPKFAHEQEHVGLGRYHVTKHTTKTVTVKALDGSKSTLTLHEIEMEQVDTSMRVTRTSHAPNVHDIGSEGL